MSTGLVFLFSNITSLIFLLLFNGSLESRTRTSRFIPTDVRMQTLLMSYKLPVSNHREDLSNVDMRKRRHTLYRYRRRYV